jgi:aromatic-L-amino-acid decarboxylase
VPPLRLSREEFPELADRVTIAATDYLASLNDRPIFPATAGPRTQAVFGQSLAEEGLGAAALHDLVEVMEHARAGNGRFFGYVLGSGEPIAALADFYASVLNQNVTAWRSAPSAITIERTVIGWLAHAIGCHEYFGSFTSGGSAANLMGLAMAREARAPANENGAQRCVVYASDEVHMSIAKAVAVLGIGRANLRSIPVDDDFRMRTDALERAIAEDERAGRDSISLDAHKWLYQPLDCSVVLYRDAEVAHATFAYSGDYARSLSEDPTEGFSFFEESIELSRRFRALKLWLSLRYHGLGQFREAIREDLRHAQLLTQLIDAEPSLERLAPTELSAVCFRWNGGPQPTLNHRNVAILQDVIRRGRVYLSNATLRGKFALRACIVNHRTTDDDIAAIVEEVLAAAEQTA